MNLKKINKLKTHHKLIFTIIVAFAVVSFWRGAWGIMDLYFFPNNALFSFSFSIIVGILILVLTGYITKELI